jgi:uncharacterized membrane protein
MRLPITDILKPRTPDPDSAEPAAGFSPLAWLFDPSNRLTWVATTAMVIALALWISFTPGGLLGKADAIGYAVCHRITARSFAFPNGRQLPMCARCSGTFLGVLVGLLGPGLLFKRRRAGLFPPLGVMAVMLTLSLWWAVDGANSFARLLPYELPQLYPPTNPLRLITGMLHGITMGSLLLPVANATLWAEPYAERSLKNFWQYLALLGIGGVLIGMILSGLGVFLYPLALLSAGGAASILVVVNTVMVTTLMGRENTARTLRDAIPLIFFGVAMTVSLIGLIDALRFVMFGTWDGFVFPTP